MLAPSAGVHPANWSNRVFLPRNLPHPRDLGVARKVIYNRQGFWLTTLCKSGYPVCDENDSYYRGSVVIKRFTTGREGAETGLWPAERPPRIIFHIADTSRPSVQMWEKASSDNNIQDKWLHILLLDVVCPASKLIWRNLRTFHVLRTPSRIISPKN